MSSRAPPAHIHQGFCLSDHRPISELAQKSALKQPSPCFRVQTSGAVTKLTTRDVSDKPFRNSEYYDSAHVCKSLAFDSVEVAMIYLCRYRDRTVNIIATQVCKILRRTSGAVDGSTARVAFQRL